jgi:hypothetical protein
MHEIYFDKEKTKPVTDYEVDADGYAILKIGKFYVFGESKVVAWGEAMVIACDKAKVVARDEAMVIACDKAKVVARDEAMVIAWGEARVEAFNEAEVVANDNSIVSAHDNSKLWATRTAKIINLRVNKCQNPT